MKARFVALPPTSHVELARRAMKDLGLSVIPIVEKGKMKGVFTKRDRMETFYQNISFDIVKYGKDVEKDMNIMIAIFMKAISKLINSKALSDNEIFDILAFQDSLAGYNKFEVHNAKRLLEITYSILARHLALRYGYRGADMIGLADYLAMNSVLKDVPDYNNDFIAYHRIFNKTIGNPTRKDFVNVDLHSVLSR